MKKILVLTLCFLLLFSAVSCKKEDDTPEATTTAATTTATTTAATTEKAAPTDGIVAGMSLSSINDTISRADNYSSEGAYHFFTDSNGDHVVVWIDQATNNVGRIERYPDRNTSKDDLSKLKRGMTLFEVSEILGVPSPLYLSSVLTFGTRFVLDSGEAVNLSFSGGMGKDERVLVSYTVELKS